ncbi:mannosyltransferase family protein [Frondihabitans australicus]|uniref:Mannosyltransferase PIG-V n=1 Tax=Frondihabitans australicus TaxID=386892 RepID=A0A495IJX9_9MICO|nr:mannosyltransferase family protein [Frondihabitans australicus]RKR76030.1 mannosyltransferase PIG-V [Frondihabitans australicus]
MPSWSPATATTPVALAPTPSPLRLLTWAQRLPWWSAVLGVYAASRVFSTILLFVMYRIASANPGRWANGYVDQDPTHGFFGFLNVWDARFYTNIAQHGYPTTLAIDAAGHVEKNGWAFLPAFPWTVRILAQMTGWDTGGVAVGVATAFGALAALMLYRLLRLRVDELGALWGTTFFCFGAVGFVLEVGYAESMFLFFLFAGTWAMLTRRYEMLLWCGVLAAFTKPGALVLALALGIVVVQRYVQDREGFPPAERVRAVIAGLAIAAAGFAWPLIAAAATGHAGAYLQTEMSWWRDVLGYTPKFVPLTPWFIMATHFLGWAGVFVVLAIVGLFVWGMRKPSLRRLGTGIRAYVVSYALYLFAVFLPQESLPRLLMPLAPLVSVDSITHSTAIRRLVLFSGMALQVTCVVTMWLTGPP